MFVYNVASMHESLWYSISHENVMSQYHYTFGMMDPVDTPIPIKENFNPIVH